MNQFTFDYLLFVFLASLGTLLLVTAYNRLNGLLLVGRRLSFTAGGLLVVVSFIWFFSSAPRNIPDTGAGLDGNEQAILFSLGAGAALVLILLLSSLRNLSMDGDPESRGIEALRHGTYLHLLLRGLRSRWISLFGRMKKHSSG